MTVLLDITLSNEMGMFLKAKFTTIIIDLKDKVTQLVWASWNTLVEPKIHLCIGMLKMLIQ